jgi:hypothetical protein
MTIHETLFDLESYGGEPAQQLRSDASERVAEVPVEDLAPGWRWIRNRSGVQPYAHLIKAQMSTASVITMCDRVGTTLSNEGITQMRRCPLCDMAQQLT